MIVVQGDTSLEDTFRNCRDATGDEDNCCEYGSDFTQFTSVTIRELVELPKAS
jgi:hypothetical protein